MGDVTSFTEAGAPAPVQPFCTQNSAQFPGNNP
jgi:hypothetical protein